MECLVLGLTAQQRTGWITALEDMGEDWRCSAATNAASALRAMEQTLFGLCVLCDGPEARLMAQSLAERPPIAAPWIVTDGFDAPGADLSLSLRDAARLRSWLALCQAQSWLPQGAIQRMPQITCLARGMLGVLGVKRSLRAWAFLPDMAALTVVHPPLMEDLSSRLYPLIGRRHGLNAATVERSLRLLVESTWSQGSLPAMERFFGHSVDPEKGKPTNREFLFRVQERLSLAAQRVR